MGRMTETLRSPEVCRGNAYELQGSEAKGGGCADMTSTLQQVQLSGTDGTAKKSSMPTGSLKSAPAKGD